MISSAWTTPWDISGTAVVNGDVMSVTYDGAVPQVAITGGRVNGKLVKGQYDSGIQGIQALPNDSGMADIVVSGGTFDNAVPEEFCAENFHPNRNPDGSYSVHTHQFGPWVTTVRPGHTTSGTEVQTCTVCGYESPAPLRPRATTTIPTSSRPSRMAPGARRRLLLRRPPLPLRPHPAA